MGMIFNKLEKKIFDSKWARMSNHNPVNHETEKEWKTFNAKHYETKKFS